jgi:flagellar biosynthetic protein FlhB
MDEESDEEKTEDPSQYRLDEFRKKGIVAVSRDISNLLAFAACTLVLFMTSIHIFRLFTDYMNWILTLNYDDAFLPKNIGKIIYKSMSMFGESVVPIFITTFVVIIVSNISQVGPIFSLELLNPKWERVNPIEGFKRIFSRKSLFELAKSIFKLIIIGSLSIVFFKKNIEIFRGLLQVGYVDGHVIVFDMIRKLFIQLSIGLIGIAAMDFAIEKFFFRQKIMQTKTQTKQEIKEREGNPEIKNRIKTIQRQLSQRKMMKDLKTATVIISNPTHYSVAIYYDKSLASPKVVAKGVDFLALRIREKAKEFEIPIVENKYLARTLYKSVKIGGSIPRTLYKAVAEILAFVYKINKNRNQQFL